MLGQGRLRFRLGTQLALQATDRAGRAAPVFLREEEGGAAVGAAEEALGGRATQAALGVAAPTHVGVVWSAVKHSVFLSAGGATRTCALAEPGMGVPLDASRGGVTIIRGPRLREHAGYPVLDRARVGVHSECSASVRICPLTDGQGTLRAMNATTPAALPYTGDPEADALLANEPMALLIGFVLDQQVTVQKAFSGPLELRRRVGTPSTPPSMAAMDPGDLEAAFRERPALHRFPGNMAKRTQAFCAAVAEIYGGDRRRGSGREAVDGPDLERRLLALPGIGEMKAKAIWPSSTSASASSSIGSTRCSRRIPPSAEVDSAEALAEYQEKKRAYKAKLKAEGDVFGA